MKKSGFRGKPSPTHIIWARGARGSSDGKKRFDQEHFEKWVNHCGFDFETATRVDHDRANGPRKQLRCVFKWGQISSESIELGNEEWNFGSQQTPRTFVEIDTSGWARVKGWRGEAVFDVVEMRHKGPKLLMKTASGDAKLINGRKFMTHPRKRQRDGATD